MKIKPSAIVSTLGWLLLSGFIHFTLRARGIVMPFWWYVSIAVLTSIVESLFAQAKKQEG